MVRRTIQVVTGGRADFGLYRWIMDALAASGNFTVEVAVTGMHLAAGYDSLAEVLAAPYPVTARVETLLASDSDAAVAKAVALGIAGFADAWTNRRPDLVMVLGDRFEMLAAAQAAYLLKLPIAHISGGDVTEGAIDDAMRHAISKLSHIHFVTNQPAAERLARMGEDPAHIHCVGSPGIDAVRKLDLADRAGLEHALDFRLRARNLMVTFHPVTLDPIPSAKQFQALLDALAGLGEEVGIIMTQANADAEGRALTGMAQDWARGRANVCLRASLGQRLYLSAVALVDAVVGNSSSGLYEVPALGVPTVNIGRRQDGRLRAPTVLDCPPETAAIAAAIDRALARGRGEAASPYGDGHTAERVAVILSGYRDFGPLIYKRFHDS